MPITRLVKPRAGVLEGQKNRKPLSRQLIAIDGRLAVNAGTRLALGGASQFRQLSRVKGACRCGFGSESRTTIRPAQRETVSLANHCDKEVQRSRFAAERIAAALINHPLGRVRQPTMQPPRQISAAPASLRPVTQERSTDSVQCLVVAADDARRDNLAFAAREGGWSATLCGDAATAVSQARLKFVQMAIVDLTGPVANDAASCRFLVEQLACISRMLLLVCGNIDDPREEVWARHLGVWMYLPGAIDGTELVGLCVAARETVERLAASNRRNGTTDRKGTERTPYRKP